MILEVVREEREKQQEIEFSYVLRLGENKEMVNGLSKALVGKTDGVISEFERVFKLCPTTRRVFSLVPTKYLIVLESVREVEEVLKEGSSLWDMFKDL